MRSARKVAVVLVDRANYGRLKPVMKAIQDTPDLDLQVVAAGTMVLERFQRPVEVVRADGFDIDAEIYLELEGSTPVTMAKSVGIGVAEFANVFQRLAPDLVLLIGDRYEALSAAIAAAYMNLCIVHLQGGEVSGSVDESARHAITKLAHYHVPSTMRSADYVVRMGEDPRTILTVGCPSSDLARNVNRTLDPAVINSQGSGIEIDTSRNFILAVFHPTTTEFGDESHQMNELLAALSHVNQPTVMLWPNIDAGSDHISKAIRVFRSNAASPLNLRVITNLTPDDYLRVLAVTACAVGNSSSFVRDAGYFGTPVVLVGNRQKGREHDRHVIWTAPVVNEIEAAVRYQLGHGRYPASSLYGDGDVSGRIANSLREIPLYAQKRLAYPFQDVVDASLPRRVV